jgi:hypothetical protein
MAEGEALRAAERLSHVQRAFQDGIIEADDYGAQRKDLRAEQKAADAAVERAETTTPGWPRRPCAMPRRRRSTNSESCAARSSTDRDGAEP